MGSNNQKQNQLLNNYKFIVNKTDPAYGDIVVYQSNTDCSELMAVIKLQSNKPELLCQQINQRLKHPNITQIYDCSQSSVKDFCGTLNIVHIGIQYIQKNLQKDLDIRRKLRTTYFEGELWYLIKTLCETLIDLQNNKQKYIDLHPQNIRITDVGQIKLLELSCTPQNISSFRKVKLGLRELEYLSSEELQELKEPQNKLNLDSEKINIFIIGIICVVCISGLEPKYFYDAEKCIFQYGFAVTKLKQYIQKYNYSQVFEQIIIQFLSYNSFQRPSYAQVLNMINSFDSGTIADHFYVKCSQQPVLLNTAKTISKSDQKTERSPEQNINKIGTFNSNSNSTPQTIKIANLVRTKPIIQQFSLTPEPRPLINRPQASSRQNSQRTQSSKRAEQTQKPSLPNYSYYDPYIDSALKKSKDLLIYHNQNSNYARQFRTNSSSVSKQQPVMASLNIQNEDYAQNYLNVQHLIKQVNIEEGRLKQQFSKSFTYQ
ncbi:unnamed protein product [Paramecium sonneborni]|uniref:Protein kinase domain-containing protein n=1 Tax=Paramecium sonneborni TaxID=65129 RepID=A0A8S1KQ59_9CILI|nr:unnamed protein product [Paramecium sonneborni]